MYYTSSNTQKNPYEPITKGCKNEQCFCTGKCKEVIAYQHSKTGQRITVNEYNEEFVFVDKSWNPNGVDPGQKDGGRL